MKPALIVSAVLLLMNFYAAFSVRYKLPSGPLVTAIVVLCFFLFFALQLVAPLLDWSLAPLPQRLSGDAYNAAVAASYLALGILSCLLVFSVVSDIAMVVIGFFLPAGPPRHVLAFLLLGGVLIALVGSLGAGLYHAGKIEVVRVDLPLKNLPAELDGLTIAHISDTHFGTFLQQVFVLNVVEQVLKLRPDMLVFTGDIADGLAEKLEPELESLKLLTPPLGKYYVTGNHEYYWQATAWSDVATRLGFRVLSNDHVVVEKGGAKLVIAGVPDLTSVRDGAAQVTNPARAAQGAPENLVKILLSHQPRVHEAAQKAGFDAQLSGHTHAGQYFPFTKLIGLVESHPKGLYDIDGFKLYVNKGTGFWGPPLRTGGFGEITLLTLRRT